MSIMSFLGSGLLGGVDDLVKTIFGSRESRDSAEHEEQMSVMDQFAAEFMPRENRTRWDSFVDGLNRLPRPIMTFGVIGLFAYCAADPAGFAVMMQALALMPEYGWGLLAVVVGFWFGGKFLGKDLKRPQPLDPRLVVEVMRAKEELEAKRQERYPPVVMAEGRPLPPISEEVL